MAIRITSTRAGDGVPTSGELQIVDADTGVSLMKGLTKLDISVRPNDIVRATMEMIVMGIDISAEPDQTVFSVQDPRDGCRKAVKRIEFADGTEFVSG